MGKKELVEIVQAVAPLDLLQANSLSGNPANVAKKANKVAPQLALLVTRDASPRHASLTPGITTLFSPRGPCPASSTKMINGRQVGGHSDTRVPS